MSRVVEIDGVKYDLVRYNEASTLTIDGISYILTPQAGPGPENFGITAVTDCDGDRWVRGEGGSWKFTNSRGALNLNLKELQEDWGPLKLEFR